MERETVRDVLVVIAGILWFIVTLALAAASFFIQKYTRKGMNAANGLFPTRLRPLMQTAQTYAGVARDFTARLPGNAAPEAPAQETVAGSRKPSRRLPRLRVPFRRRRRRIPFLR